MNSDEFERVIAELEVRNSSYQLIFCEWNSILEELPSAEDNLWYGLIFLSVNEYALSSRCLEKVEQKEISMPLLLINSILEECPDRATVIELTMRIHGSCAVGSGLARLAKSLAYKAVGEVELAVDHIPSLSELDEFILSTGLKSALKKAINLHQILSELHLSIAIHFMGIKNYQESNEYFARAIEITPMDDHLLCCYALCLNYQMDFSTAQEVLKLAIAIQPNNDSYYSLLAKTLGDLGADDESILDLQMKAYKLNPEEPEHAVACCKSYIRSSKWSELLEFTSIAQNLNDTEDQRLTCYRAVAAANLVDFDILRSEENLYARLGVTHGQLADPFVCLWFDKSAERQFTRAVRYCKRIVSALPDIAPLKKREVNPDKKIKVGIFSGDFCNHAGMTLMLHLFKLFDRNKFDVIALDTGTQLKDAITDLIRSWCTEYIDCVHMSTNAISEVCRNLDLDVAIDRGGHTGTNRINIFAHRLAPIQIAYLAYPSTTGAEFIDYIIGDSVVIPRENYKYFTESIIQLPCCYQPNSRHLFKETPSVERPRELPIGKIVLGCFNAIHKLRVEDFELWAKILERNPETVIWLIGAGPVAKINIIKFFESSGIDSQRIVFSNKTSWRDHQARLGFTDLCIDSQTYGSHTTATDCLSNSVPIITLQGDGFQTRVCSSILKHLDLGELVAESSEEFLAIIEKLIKDNNQRQAIRVKIRKIMSDSEVELRAQAYSNHFFNALEKVHLRYQAGQPPSSLKIK